MLTAVETMLLKKPRIGQRCQTEKASAPLSRSKPVLARLSTGPPFGLPLRYGIRGVSERYSYQLQDISKELRVLA